MWEGKKSVAARAFYDAMDIIGKRVKDASPLEVFEARSLGEGGGYGMVTLKSGRIVMACGEYKTKRGKYTRAGELMPGVPINNRTPWFQVSGFGKTSVLRAAISDDNGHNHQSLVKPTVILQIFPHRRKALCQKSRAHGAGTTEQIHGCGKTHRDDCANP